MTCRICLEEEPEGLLRQACGCRGEGNGIHISCAARSCAGEQNVFCKVCRMRFALPVAERVYRDVLDLDDVPDYVRIGFQVQLGEVLERQGRDAEAHAELVAALGRTNDVIMQGRVLKTLAKVLTRSGRYSEAGRHLDTAERAFATLPLEAGWQWLAGIRFNRVEVYEAKGEYHAAAELLRAVVVTNVEQAGEDAHDTMVARGKLVLMLHKSGDNSSASRELQQLMPRALRILGGRHPDYLQLAILRDMVDGATVEESGGGE